MTSNRPEEALEGFYGAMFRDRDFDAASRYASPQFYLKPSNVFAGNVNADAPHGKPVKMREPQLEVRHGSRSELAARVQAKRGHFYPWSAWVRGVSIAADGRTADAHTSDGSAGLEVVDGEWRVLWVHDAL